MPISFAYSASRSSRRAVVAPREEYVELVAPRNGVDLFADQPDELLLLRRVRIVPLTHPVTRAGVALERPTRPARADVARTQMGGRQARRWRYQPERRMEGVGPDV